MGRAGVGSISHNTLLAWHVLAQPGCYGWQSTCTGNDVFNMCRFIHSAGSNLPAACLAAGVAATKATMLQACACARETDHASVREPLAVLWPALKSP